MKKLIPAIAVLIVLLGLGAWLTFSLRAKRSYDKLRLEVGLPLSVVQMDDPTKLLLAEVQTDWLQHYSEVSGPYSDAVRLFGLNPSVSNLIKVFTYHMPEYSWVSPGRSQKSALLGAVQIVTLPMSVDRLVHVSQDQHLAMIRIKPHVVHVFADEAGGLRETLYYEKQTTPNSVLKATP